MSYDYENEREAALANEAMNDGEYHSAALSQYASAHGADDAEAAWVLTPFDTWERNPYYTGAPVPHPEDDDAHREDDGEPAPFVELPF